MRLVVLSRNNLHWRLPLVLCAILTLLLVWQRTPAAGQSPGDGQAIFEAKCAACHTIGGGVLVGPDLEDVTNRQETEWLTRWITNPDAMLAEGDPIATALFEEFNGLPMPNLGITTSEAASIISYFESRSTQTPSTADETSETTTATKTTEAPIVAEPYTGDGDASTGKSLFDGTIRFDNGGPPCLACHSVSSIGSLGGGALGPELTGAYNRFGSAGLVSILATTPFPTMSPIFDDQPLTEEEQAHLTAFLSEAGISGREAASVGVLALLALAGAATLLLLMRLKWRRRLIEVRRPMIAKSRARVEKAQQTRLQTQKSKSKVESR